MVNNMALETEDAVSGEYPVLPRETQVFLVVPSMAAEKQAAVAIEPQDRVGALP